jgi:hypothetical protein
MINGPFIKEVLGDDLLDNVFHNLLAKLLCRDLLGVLCGDDNGVDTERDRRAAVLLVLDRDLGLRVGAEPRQDARAACGSQCRIELVGEHDGEGHVLGRFIGSIAKHDSLVSRTVCFERAVVETLGNVGRLLLDSDEDVAGLVVEALGRVVVADVLDGVADDLLVVEVGLGRNLAKDHDHASFGCRLAGNLGPGVLLEASIEL